MCTGQENERSESELGKGAETQNLSYLAGGSANWHSLVGKRFGANH